MDNCSWGCVGRRTQTTSPHHHTGRLPWAMMRGQPNTFREHWIEHRVVTPAGELTYMVFGGAGACFEFAGRFLQALLRVLGEFVEPGVISLVAAGMGSGSGGGLTSSTATCR